MSNISLPSRCSADALTSVQPVMPILQATVYNYIDSCGLSGCTDEEGQIATGIPGNTWRPCRLKLEKMGKVGLTGAHRKTISGRESTIWFNEYYSSTFRFIP